MRIARCLISLAPLVLVLSGSAWSQTCTFILTPPSASFPASGGNDQIAISASSQTCSRTAISNAIWITISFGSPGTGDGSVGYTVASNPFLVERTGTLTVAGTTFTVTQSASTCTYTLSPSSANVPNTGGTGSFNITTGNNSCPWTVVSGNPDWLTLTSAASGTGNGTVKFSAAPNALTTARTGTITVNGQAFTVTEAASCGFTVSPLSVQASALGSSATFAVQSSATSCAWTATSNNTDWLTVTSGGAGTGNGTLGYTVSPNTSGADRVGSIAVGTTGFVVYQTGSGCSFTLNGAASEFPSNGGGGIVTVTSACPWTATSNSAWIVINAPLSNTTGNGTVTYGVAGNPTATPRTGSITVGTQMFTIRQAGVPCLVTISPSSALSPAAGTTGAIGVSALPGCAWSGSTTAFWITLTVASGSGDGEVAYTVLPTNSAQRRTATIIIANQTFTLTQEAGSCDLQLTPGQAGILVNGGPGTFNVNTGCAWSAISNAPWIIISQPSSGTGNGTVTYSVTKYTGVDPRIATIKVGIRTFTVTQYGSACTLTLNPARADLPGTATKGLLNVGSNGSCRWEPFKDAEWITIASWFSINGAGGVNYTVAANSGQTARTGNIVIAGQVFQITQAAATIQIDPAGVVNAASFTRGPVAPGEIVTIYGSLIGPGVLAPLQLTGDGQFLSTALAQTRVLFDGVAAPLLYASASQVSAIVPYGVSGKTSTQIEIEYQGARSSAVNLDVAAAAPAIFTTNTSGSGQGAILNEDFTVNSAANPAARNSIVQVYSTGEGQTVPAGIDGKLALLELPKPQLPVTVQIGGVDAPVIYVGAAPQLTAGLMQVNVRVPIRVAPGDAVPIVLRVGNFSSQAQVTVAVK